MYNFDNDLKTQCLIDLDGREYYVDMSKYDDETKYSIISIHLTIAKQISNGKFDDDYYSRLGWITNFILSTLKVKYENGHTEIIMADDLLIPFQPFN